MTTFPQLLILETPLLLVLTASVWIIHTITKRMAKPDPSSEINAKTALEVANTLKTWLENEAGKSATVLQSENRKAILPLKIQACERLTLMLERITLTSVLMRTGSDAITAGQLEFQMLQSIREEFEHNITQQLFVGDETWQLVKAAREEATAIIKQASSGLSAEAPATDLMVKIIETQNLQTISSTHQALNSLRREIGQLF